MNTKDYQVLANGCWQWLLQLDPDGYAHKRISSPRRNVRAHRYYYELTKGAIPSGLPLDHLCRNRGCVNPDHLEPVTMQENVLRGEGVTAQNKLKTHCPRGHAYDETNTHITPGGGRRCKACWPIDRLKYKSKGALT